MGTIFISVSRMRFLIKVTIATVDIDYDAASGVSCTLEASFPDSLCNSCLWLTSVCGCLFGLLFWLLLLAVIAVLLSCRLSNSALFRYLL